MSLIPSSYQSLFRSLPLPIKNESHNEEYRSILCFIGGVSFIISIKYCNEGLQQQRIQHAVYSFCQDDMISLENRSVTEFIVMFLYSLIHIQQVSLLCK